MTLTGFLLDFTTVTMCQGAKHRTLGSVPEHQALGVDRGQEESPDSQFICGKILQKQSQIA